MAEGVEVAVDGVLGGEEPREEIARLRRNAERRHVDGRRQRRNIALEDEDVYFGDGEDVGIVAVPGQPVGNPEPGMEAATGINDLLTAAWISKKGPHHGKHHFAPGVAMQFPTGTSDSLGSGKWSIGPSFDYEYENGRLFAGAIALQIWSFAGEADRKDVNMLMIKPFVVFSHS